MSEYWRQRTTSTYECSSCGGTLLNDGSAPIGGGYIVNYRCIRCGSTGGKRYQRGTTTINGNIQKSQ